MLWQNVRRELAEPENSAKVPLPSPPKEVVFKLRMEACPGTNQATKEEEERVFQDERAHIEKKLKVLESRVLLSH